MFMRDMTFKEEGSMKKNNVNVQKLQETRQGLEKGLQKAKKVNVIEGNWNTQEGAQFEADIKFEGGKVALQCEQPTFLGGSGAHPGPMLYCLYGFASCFTATFAMVAAQENVELKSLRVKAESHVDFSRAFGLTENPPVEKVSITLFVQSDAPQEKIQEIEKLAQKRCPAIYCITNPVPLSTQIVVNV